MTDAEEQVTRLRRRVARERAARREAEDIAERATARLYAALRAVEQERDSLRAVAAAAGHDIKNPLASIMGFARLLQAGKVPDEGRQAEILDRMVRNTAYTASLVDGLLEVLGAGLEGPAEDPVELDPIAADLAAELVVRHPAAEVVTAPLGRATADPTAVRRLLDNLLENAARHGGREDITITLDVAMRTPTAVTLRIADDGRGVDTRDREAIFDIFRRGSRAEPGTGTGIGLAICRRLALGAGGDLSLSPDPGPAGGAAFLLQLPA